MKNILKKLLIILLASILTISISIISNADNETTASLVDSVEEDINVISDGVIDSTDSASYETDYDYQENYFTFTSEDVTINEIIDGDAFIFSIGTVTINTVITGNVFVCAADVIISQTAEIYSSLFSASENLSISGIVYGNVYSASSNFNLNTSSYIGTDLFIIGDSVIIEGFIYRNANIYANQVTISENAYIANDLNYSAENEATVSDGIVGGNIQFNIISYDEDYSYNFTDWLYSAVSYILLAIVIFVICKWIHCKFIDKSQNLSKDALSIILWGLFGLFIIPIICVILLALGVTISIAFILMLIYCIFGLIASTILIIALSSLCAEKLKEKLKTNDNLRTICFIIIFGVVYKLLQEIPTLGAIVTFIAVLMGFGILIKYLIPEKQKTENKN